MDPDAHKCEQLDPEFHLEKIIPGPDRGSPDP
jgi:hypothetical protein